jgi:hypothetical protein
MARMEQPQSIRVELGASRLAAAFILVSHFATAILVASMPGGVVLRAAIVIAVGGHALWTLRGSAARSLPSSIIGAELGADRRATLIRRDGGRISGLALPQSYVSEWLTTLLVRPDGRWRAYSLWLLPDMLPREELRRFRVLLRLGRPEAG